MKTFNAIILMSSIAQADFTPEQQIAADKICGYAQQMISVAIKMDKEQKIEKVSGVSNIIIKRELGEQFARLMEKMGDAFTEGQKLGVDTGIKASLESSCHNISKQDESFLNAQIKRITGVK